MSSLRGMILAILFLATGIVFLFISLASLSQTGNTAQTPLYIQGCIFADARAADNSLQQLELGHINTQGNCADTSTFRVGYQITPANLTPALPGTLTSGMLPTVEVWYRPHLTTGVCGSDKHSCQIADVVALRTYILNKQNTVVPAVLYKSADFFIKGDLTQANYNPHTATYLKAGVSIWLPILFLLAGLLLISASILLMLDYRKKQNGVSVREVSRAL
ncbi:MAG: hypothetical protein ACYDER_07335 [Ktedonobacteraceae bacterium]